MIKQQAYYTPYNGVRRHTCDVDVIGSTLRNYVVRFYSKVETVNGNEMYPGKDYLVPKDRVTIIN